MEGWTEKMTMELIENYKKFDFLWNPQSQYYFKNDMKQDAWKSISLSLGKSPKACKRKLESLMSSYRRERAKEKSFKEKAKNPSELYRSSWYAYEALRFLEKREKPRIQIKREPDSPDEEVSSQVDGGQQDRLPEPLPEPVCATSEDTCEKPAKKPKINRETKLMTDALDLMKIAAERLLSSATKDSEAQTFGKFVIAKLESYPPETRKAVEHAIFDILVKADKGFYENPAHLNQFQAGSTQYIGCQPENVPSIGLDLQTVLPTPLVCLKTEPPYEESQKTNSNACRNVLTASPLDSSMNSPSSQSQHSDHVDDYI